ncbi:MAG: ABC transporter ATP-binding protein [Betaproteobacteria bacterium]|nr:ABC transporter ATP-binding protein [Betaproteobacteria bacterium]
MSPPLLACRGLTVSIGGKTVVSGLDLTLGSGACLVILGRNGAGKTTLLSTLAGLRVPDAGTVELDGQGYAALTPRAAARLRGWLSQHPVDAFPATVLETVLMGRHPHLSRWAWEGAEDHALAHAALKETGLEAFAARALATLSGGERQRVAIATLLVQQPRVWLLDEPLTHLDLNHQIAMLELFRQRMRTEHTAAVMVLHDLNLAARYADQALLLHDDGRFDLGPAREVLTPERLTRLYGHPLREITDGGGRWFVPEARSIEAGLNDA